MNHTPLEQVREALAAYLATPASFPLIQRHPQSDQLEVLHDRRKPQRFLAEPAPVTAFGQLEGGEA